MIERNIAGTGMYAQKWQDKSNFMMHTSRENISKKDIWSWFTRLNNMHLS